MLKTHLKLKHFWNLVTLMSPLNNDSVINIDSGERYLQLCQISIGTRDINSEREFEYDLTEEDRNTLTLLLLCKLALALALAKIDLKIKKKCFKFS